MTGRDRPTPPAALNEADREALATLERCDAETLRAVASYVDELAAWKDAATAEDDATEARPDEIEFPDDVPDRASVTITEIGETTYYYYQWRDGDEIRSKTETL